MIESKSDRPFYTTAVINYMILAGDMSGYITEDTRFSSHSNGR